MPSARLRSFIKNSSPFISGLVGAVILGGFVLGLSFVIRGSPLANDSGTAFSDDGTEELRILAYSSFTSAWGPGPALAKIFEDTQGIKVILLQADDAGLLLAKMDSFPADVVLGFDQLSLPLAKRSKVWRDHGVVSPRFPDARFLAFDWSPVGFLYREGEIDPPRNFDDLLNPRFEGAIALQDPRSSSPGLQFLNWLALEMGEDPSFEFLARLKPNVHSMSGSWSQSYGLFTRGLAKLSFGYATSVLYHQQSENDDRYKFAKFPTRHPVQVEFAAIPESCRQCAAAQKFMAFLVSVEAQTVIMNRNWMLPVNAEAAQGSPFADLMALHESDKAPPSDTSEAETKPDPAQLLKRWSEVGL